MSMGGYTFLQMGSTAGYLSCNLEDKLSGMSLVIFLTAKVL